MRAALAKLTRRFFDGLQSSDRILVGLAVPSFRPALSGLSNPDVLEVMMTLQEALDLPLLKRTKVITGSAGLERTLRWVHVIDYPDPVPWAKKDQLILTTGYNFPRHAAAQEKLIHALAAARIAGLALAVPQCFATFPKAMRQAGKALDLPLLEIPWELPFADITEAIHSRILSEQHRVIERSEQVHRLISRAALKMQSLQELVDTLGTLIQRSVIIENRQGRLLAAYSVSPMEDAIRREMLETGARPPRYKAHLVATGMLKRLRQGSKPLRIPPSADGGIAARVACAIRLPDEVIGYLWIIEGEHPLTELDLRAAEHTSAIAAIHIAHQRALVSLENRLGSTFLDSLIGGRFSHTPQALERARLFGYDPNGAYRLGLIVLDEPVPLSQRSFLKREELADRLRRRLEDLGVIPLLSSQLDRLLFLLPETCDPDAVWQALRQRSLKLVLSQVEQGHGRTKAAYDQVLSILPHAQPGSCSRYEHYLVPRVLAGDATAQEELSNLILAPLRPRKKASKEALVETLFVLAEQGFSLNQTASALGIHISTLRYRLERIAKLAKLDLSCAETRFKIQLVRHLSKLK